MRRALGDVVPGLPLHEGRRRAGDEDRNQVGSAPQRDARRAAMEGAQAARGRASPFGKQQQRPALTEALGARSDDRVGTVVRDVAGALHEAPQQQVALGRCLHDAVGLRHRGHQEHDVDERRVVGDDQDGPLAQPLPADPGDPDQPGHGHVPGEQPEGMVDEALHPSLRVAGAARRQLEQGQRDQADHEGAEPEQRERDPGAESSPGAPQRGHPVGGGRRALSGPDDIFRRRAQRLASSRSVR